MDQLNTFPANTKEALAFLYLQKQDLSNASPEDVARLYWEAYYRISAVNADAKKTASADFKSGSWL